ncbi:peptide ABC transporter substrate-binding protein [Bythopirellula polymerisocia]|uniref:Periplasmic oligopeptide-binding protein n=1 Tax=Bythopirellula polymerisocia TaxID=2528003 RepID=A0A5C6CV23_9BACT|nr:peptide ABC transporter substrate-binding protein [Bythopirellula polymerisocia]TWU28298.1 Periplasmic oligopeptide-binding protein precursor [Bythopirellula polymerisocia]
MQFITYYPSAASYMSDTSRSLIAALLFACLLLGSVWATLGGGLPPADFTVINESEIKSVDPALISGQPEGRIAYAIFEGLVRNDPKTLEPIPGVAARWEISENRLTYTFYLRNDARWSNGEPVTAHDFAYSWRRFLDPRTAAEYAYQAWYIKNAHNYSLGGSGIEPDDPVEVELNLSPDAKNTLRGKILHGKLVRILPRNDDERDFIVEIGGKQITYRPTDDSEAADYDPPQGVAWCRQVLLDFREVGIEVLDDLTLQVTLENPTPYFLGLLGFYPLFPVNQRCLETYGAPDWTKSRNIVTNGAYTIAFRRIRDRIRLVKNKYYWNRENVRLEVVDVLAVESLTTALNLYLTGKADWISNVPPPAMRELIREDPPRNDLNPAPYLSSYYYLINTLREPLNDVRIRRALSMALDREEITSSLLPAGEPVSLSLVPPGIEGYQMQTADAENIEEARRLFAEAGYPEGHGFPRLEILTNTQETHLAIAELIRKQWQRALGITVKTRNEEWGAYQTSLRQGKYDIARRGWISDYTDPNTFLDMFISHSEQNSTGWSNAKYDQLVENARQEVDPEKRFRLLEKAERILLDELPLIPIYTYVSKNMVKPYVRGFYNNVQDEHYIWAMWIDHSTEGSNEFMRSGP